MQKILYVLHMDRWAGVLRFKRSLIWFCICMLILSEDAFIQREPRAQERIMTSAWPPAHSSMHRKMLWGLYKVIKTNTTEMLVLCNLNDLFHESHLYSACSMFWFKNCSRNRLWTAFYVIWESTGFLFSEKYLENNIDITLLMYDAELNEPSVIIFVVLEDLSRN